MIAYVYDYENDRFVRRDTDEGKIIGKKLKQRKKIQLNKKLLATPRNKENCSICLDPINISSNIVSPKNCRHKFHKKCIINWALSNNKKDSNNELAIICPNCLILSFGHNAKRKNSKQKKSKNKKNKK
jgi:hypothetical protein